MAGFYGVFAGAASTMSNIHLLSPTPSSSTIPEVDVTAARLSSLLTSAVIEHKIDDDGHIFATDGVECPLWIDIDSERKLLCFFTHYPLPDHWERKVQVKDLLEAVNTVNGKHILVQFYWNADKVFGTYWMTYDERLDPRHFIKMLRRFSSAFVEGIEHLQEVTHL